MPRIVVQRKRCRLLRHRAWLTTQWSGGIDPRSTSGVPAVDLRPAFRVPEPGGALFPVKDQRDQVTLIRSSSRCVAVPARRSSAAHHGW
jgi:hypothetical protein